MFEYVWLIPLFPLIGVVINGLFGKKIKNEMIIGGIASLAVFGSFLVSCGILVQLLGMPGEERHFEKTIFTCMGIDAADSNFRIPYSGLLQGGIAARDGALHKPRLNLRNCVNQSNVCRHVQHPHLRRAQHH